MRDADCIGGFFGLETPSGTGPAYHREATALATGRSCLSLALRALEPARIWMPYYACSVLHQAITPQVDVQIYSVDRTFQLADPPAIGEKDCLLYINYFGVMDLYVERLKTRYGARLIIDDTHNFFRRGHAGHWSFCSARKYFGVPDGAYLYGPRAVDAPSQRNERISMDHLVNRRSGDVGRAHRQFVEYENQLDAVPRKISEVSERLLERIDYDAVRQRRRDNFQFLHDSLGTLNQLDLGHFSGDAFCYPLLPEVLVPKEALHRQGIFVPTLWPDVIRNAEPRHQAQASVCRQLLPLPTDHRYRPADLERVVREVMSLVSAEASA